MSTVESELRYMTGDNQGAHEMPVSSELLPISEPFLVAETGVTPNMERLVQLASRAAPPEIAMAVLEEVGLAPKRDLVEQYRAEAQQTWTKTAGDMSEVDEGQTQVIRIYDELAVRVQQADALQRSYWEEYRQRGQNVDKVEALFEETQDFEHSSVLTAMNSLNFRTHSDARVQDAERIVRIMIRSEVRGASQ